MRTQKSIFLFLSALSLLALNWISCKKEEPVPETPYDPTYSISWQGYKLLLYQTSDDSTSVVVQTNDTLTFTSIDQFLYHDSTYQYSVTGSHYGPHIFMPSLPPYGVLHWSTLAYPEVGDTLHYQASRPNHVYDLWMRRIE